MGKTDFKDQVIKELKAKYSKVKINKQWLSALNANPRVLGFDDDVYDFGDPFTVPNVILGFRDGTPEDMVTMTVKITRGHVENCDKTIQAGILETIESMHVNPEVYNFIIHTLATSIVGYRPRDKFQIWTGGGDNGKGLTKTIVVAAFGEYFYEPGQAMFSSRGVTATYLSGELAKLAGKRICMTSESEKIKIPVHLTCFAAAC